MDFSHRHLINVLKNINLLRIFLTFHSLLGWVNDMCFWNFIPRWILFIITYRTPFITLSSSTIFPLGYKFVGGTQVHRVIWMQTSLRKRFTLRSLSCLGFSFLQLIRFHIHTNYSPRDSWILLNFLCGENSYEVWVPNII